MGRAQEKGGRCTPYLGAGFGQPRAATRRSVQYVARRLHRRADAVYYAERNAGSSTVTAPKSLVLRVVAPA